MRTLSRFGLFIAVLSFCVAGVGGCSKGETLYPASGKVTVKNAPLSGGQVTFVPDQAKGNKSKLSPVGKVGSDGAFTLTSEGRSGAPLGWYKVTVATDTPGMGGTMPVEPGATKPAPLGSQGSVQIDPKYKDSSKTPLSVEVVASPAAGAYDLKIQ
jgi:hypothetical protein